MVLYCIIISPIKSGDISIYLTVYSIINRAYSALVLIEYMNTINCLMSNAFT